MAGGLLAYLNGEDAKAIEQWNQLLRTLLVGVGQFHHCHGELYVAADGRLFGRSTVHDAFYFEGDNFDSGIERLLLGRRSRPILRPDQTSVDLYGHTYTREHLAVYNYTAQHGLAAEPPSADA